MAETLEPGRHQKNFFYPHNIYAKLNNVLR